MTRMATGSEPVRLMRATGRADPAVVASPWAEMSYLRSVVGAALILAGAVVSACASGGQSRPSSDLGGVATHQDSLSEANARLYSLVRTVDRVGRRSASLPATLDEVRDEPGVSLSDPWGRRFSYSASERDFSIRSAGRDGTFDTADDVVATARLGRAIPCELRDQVQITRFERVAPLCDAAKVEVLYPLCPVLEQADSVERAVPPTLRDSVLAMGRRLVRVARAIDGYGREIGTLPLTLRGPVIWGRADSGELLDSWGRAVRYRPSNDRFELRSPGPDGLYDSSDDVVVYARLGQTIPCAFQAGQGSMRCDAPPPACPGSS